MCEVTTEEVCQFLTEALPVPVVSLGAGNKAHGVHIISSDLFHLYEEHTPRHSKIYTDLIPIIEDVYTRYMTDVRARTYPGPEHTAYMAPKELEQFAAKVGWSNPPIEAAEQREKVKTTVDYQIGETVKVIGGPLSDFTGSISDINVDQSRLKVLVSIFGRETPVELSFNQVAKL